MEATKSANVGAKPRPTWTDREVAFVLNFADYCLQQKQDYKSSIAGEMSRYVKRPVTATAVESKMRKTIINNCNAKYVEFVQKGTRSLDVRSIPINVFKAMQPQRKVWGLDELNREDEAEGATTQTVAVDTKETTASDATHMRRKASMRDGGGSPKSYREQEFSDAEHSGEDPLDSDFGSQHVKKKRKLNAPTRNQPPRRQRGTTAPVRTTRDQTQELWHKSASVGEREVAAVTARPLKRKLETAEVVDIASVPPSSKRQAVESAFEGAKMTAEDPMVLPVSQSSHATGVVQNDRPAASLRTQMSSQMHVPTQSAFLDPGQARAKVSSQRTETVLPQKAENQAKKSAKTQAQRTAPTPSQNATAVPTQETPDRSAEDITVMDGVRDLAELVAVLLREQVKSSFGMTKVVEDRLKCINRTVERAPGQLLAKMLQDVHSIDASRADLRDLVRHLVGRRELVQDNVFPRVQEPSKIDKSWKVIRKHVKESFGIWDQPCGPEPKAEDAGYVAARMDDLMKNRPNAGLDSPKQFIEELASYLESPFSSQALLGALLCGWLFSGPEPMCDKVYSEKELKMYKALLLKGDADKVQQIDKIGMKLMFEDKKFQESNMELRAEKLLDQLEGSLKEAWPGVPGFHALNSPQEWAETAVKLKQTLMLNQNDYRIHYCKPGSLFDPTWMQAEDMEGFPIPDAQAQTKSLAICLFPALSEQDPTPFVDTTALDHVLVSKKNFFPSVAEKRGLDLKRVISKAVVLVV